MNKQSAAARRRRNNGGVDQKRKRGEGQESAKKRIGHRVPSLRRGKRRCRLRLGKTGVHTKGYSKKLKKKNGSQRPRVGKKQIQPSRVKRFSRGRPGARGTDNC